VQYFGFLNKIHEKESNNTISEIFHDTNVMVLKIKNNKIMNVANRHEMTYSPFSLFPPLLFPPLPLPS
jgi:hypothetical protein